MIFEEKFEPIKINVKNIKGEEFSLESRFLSSEEIKEIEKISVDESLTNTEVSHKIMYKYFGKTERFYSQFSIELLGKIAEYLQQMQKKN